MGKKITEQDDIIHSMQLGLQLATVQHETLLHTTNKDIRQHCVDKQDAVDEATKARQDLAFLKQKNIVRQRHTCIAKAVSNRSDTICEVVCFKSPQLLGSYL
jgi:hypothetical protein